VSSPSEIETCEVLRQDQCSILRLLSNDGQNRLTLDRIRRLSLVVRELATEKRPLIITGNQRFFSSGADLNEITSLNSSKALQFARTGQQFMTLIAEFPAPTIAAISGYCMGGGLDLALSCRWRVASRSAVFGHRGAALGLITGWGGTQRLPKTVGFPSALSAFVQAEKFNSDSALAMGLVHEIAADPVAASLMRMQSFK